MGVGPEIRRIREAKKLSQTKVAALADMSVSGLSQIETGARNPSAVTLAKIADALGVEVAALFPKGQPSLPFETRDREYRTWATAATTEDLMQEKARLSGRLDEILTASSRSPEQSKERRMTAKQREALHHLAPTADKLHIVVYELAERIGADLGADTA